MASSWKPLRLHCKRNDIPPLLVKHEFGPSHYKVWLTDLSYIWTESLDRRQMTRRALNIDTSIDPSEDSGQLSLFLRSIADALRQSPGTCIELDESSDVKQLTLKTSTPLPHPIQPLQWPIVLMLAPQSAFAVEFVSPLLSQQLTAKVEKTSLLQQLKDKDNVISKLIEKLQGDGVDLGKVFPGVVASKSGAGSTARGAVAKSVNGLREFDKNQWESQIARENGISRDVESLLPLVFSDDGVNAGEGLQIADYGEWWKRVGSRDSHLEGSVPAIPKTDAKQESIAEDGFQRQLTPTKPSIPRREGLTTDMERKNSISLGQKSLDDGGSTTDESDDNLQSFPSNPLPSRTDDALASNSTNYTKGIQSEPMDLDENGLTASGSDVDKSPAKSPLVPNSKQRLGKIGSKGRDSSSEPPVIPISKPKLGKIGGIGKLGKSSGTKSVSTQNEDTASNRPKDSVSPKREARDQVDSPKESEKRGRMVQDAPEPSPPRETSHDRANRKREQLKRELENKSQAATKKKRKF